MNDSVRMTASSYSTGRRRSRSATSTTADTLRPTMTTTTTPPSPQVDELDNVWAQNPSQWLTYSSDEESAHSRHSRDVSPALLDLVDPDELAHVFTTFSPTDARTRRRTRSAVDIPVDHTTPPQQHHNTSVALEFGTGTSPEDDLTEAARGFQRHATRWLLLWFAVCAVTTFGVADPLASSPWTRTDTASPSFTTAVLPLFTNPSATRWETSNAGTPAAGSARLAHARAAPRNSHAVVAKLRYRPELEAFYRQDALRTAFTTLHWTYYVNICALGGVLLWALREHVVQHQRYYRNCWRGHPSPAMSTYATRSR
jgi:hypothetical protein